jgi:hypothetical protein
MPCDRCSKRFCRERTDFLRLYFFSLSMAYPAICEQMEERRFHGLDGVAA